VRSHFLIATALIAALRSAATPSSDARTVTKETVEGVTNFSRLGTAVACAGATKAQAVPEIRKMGFASIINLRQADELGPDVEVEAAAAKVADIRYYSIPFNGAAPDPAAADKFLDAITEKGSEPAFIHCAGRRPRGHDVVYQTACDRSLGRRQPVTFRSGHRALQSPSESLRDKSSEKIR
jgi:protein tyrosine phosphatase (PTP) superfamily phosphohydrolase (DUF442 family)